MQCDDEDKENNEKERCWQYKGTTQYIAMCVTFLLGEVPDIIYFMDQQCALSCIV